MAWAKLDDQIFYNKKVAQVDGPAKLLYIAGLVYVANQLTDGLIPEKAVRFIASTADVANCQDFAKQLLDVGLWVATDEGYMIHDYLEWNPSKERVEQTREERAEAGRRGGLAKAAKSKQIAKQNASKEPSKPLAKSKQKSAPSPSLLSSSKEEDPTPVLPVNGTYNLATTLAEVCGMAFEPNKGRLLAEAKRLHDAKPEPTPDLLREHYGDGGWWWWGDWRGKKGEHPQPATVRETWGKWAIQAPGSGASAVY